MEKVELTPVELMQALNWKKSKVYYWISSGKFETVERLEGQKVVISREDLERSKKSNNYENFENFETVSENPNNFEKFQQNQEQNVTKNYKNVQNNLTPEFIELFNNSLETIKQIHQTSLNNFGYTTKLLSDGKNELEKENYERKAEVKTVQARLEKSENEKMENLKKFEKVSKWKNLIIFVLLFVLICSTVFISFVLISSNETKTEEIKQEPVQIEKPVPAKVTKKK